MLVYYRLALILGVFAVLFVGGVPSAKAAVVGQSLGRTFEKLRTEKKLKVAYFGGSITAGVGASDPAKTSWRAQTTSWFQRHFPQATITEVNAAAGGGSLYGTFRCSQDLIKQDPDLLFLEFAVDDADLDEQRVLRSMEGVVRQFWTANPWAEIVLVFTTTKKLSAAYDRDEVPRAVGYHRAVARHYGIPEIDVGRALTDAVATGAGTWESFTTDGVHPTDAGATVYAQAIATFLDAHQMDRVEEPVLTLPDSLTKDPFSGAHQQAGTMLYAPGWQKVEASVAAPPSHIAADSPGTELVHKFSGSTVGLLWLVGPDGGEIEWSIDGGPPQRLSSWSKTAAGSTPIQCVILADDLSSNGEHTLTVRIHSEKNPQSTGTWIRIAAILMHCAC